MPTNAAWLGIDIGAGSAKLALLRSRRADDGWVALGETAPYDHPTLDALGADVRDAAGTLLDEAGQAAVQAVGLAVPGPMGRGGVVEQCGNLPALDGVDGGTWVRAVLRGRLDAGAGVHVMTDTGAAAAGAWAVDPKPGRVLYLSLGTGVGAAVLDDGRPLAFTRGTPGHVGHLDLSGGDPHAPATPAAGRGAAEAYLGAPALRAAGLPLDDPARCADHPAMDHAVNALARLLRLLLPLYRMDHAVLLGGVAPIFQPHLDTLRERTNDRLTTAAPKRWSLTLATTGRHTAAQGAALIASQSDAPDNTPPSPRY